MSGHGGDPKRVVRAALIANAGIAVAKFIAAYISESTTMLAEGVHSVADTANQALLWVGIVLSLKRADERYQFGRATESYFWLFIVALLLFFLGGVFAIYEGMHKLSHAEPGGSPWVAIGVLLVAILLEGASFRVAWNEFQKGRGGRSFREALFGGKDPVIPVVLLEDIGALLGLVLALIAVLVTYLTGDSRFDGMGSIVIGFLLCTIGIFLANDTRSLLIGESITTEVRAQTISIIESITGIKRVRQLLSLHLGPDTVLLALKVQFDEGMSLAEAERLTNEAEDKVRAELPQMKRIFIEPDSRYEAALDKGDDESSSTPATAQ